MIYRDDGSEIPTIPVEIDKVKAKTDKAWLFIIDGEEKWIPSSLVDNEDELFAVGDEGIEIECAEWYAVQENFV